MEEKHVRARYGNETEDIYGYLYESLCGGGYDEANQSMDGLASEGVSIEEGAVSLLCRAIDVMGLQDTLASFPEVELQPYFVKAVAAELSADDFEYEDGDDSSCGGVVTYSGEKFNFTSYYYDEATATHEEAAAECILKAFKERIEKEAEKPAKKKSNYER